MRNTNKKGFTIVELVIVVAVIAILAAVLIPTFSGIIRKANESKDTQLVKHLNTAIAADVNGDKTMSAAIAAAAEFGFDLSKIDAKVEGNEILWDSVANVFCYLNNGKVEYIGEVANKGTGAQLWIIDTDGNTETHATYSSYVANVEAGKTVVANNSIDTTACPGVNVEYKGANNVNIYTNGGVLTVDAPSATVNHYGDAAEVYVNAVSANTFNLYAKVGYLEVAAGQHVVLKSGSKANAIFAASADDVDVENGQPESVVVTSGDKEAVKTGATLFAGGVGTAEDPYLIATDEQFANIHEVYSEDNATVKNFQLTADITVTGDSNINIDAAIVDLGGYTLTIDRTTTVFYVSNSATIQNGNLNYAQFVTLLYTNQSADAKVTVKFENLEMNGDITGGQAHYGPLVSYMYAASYKGTYEIYANNVINNMNIKSTQGNAGAMFGYIQGGNVSASITNCVFNGTIQGVQVGGFFNTNSYPVAAKVINSGNIVNGSILGSSTALPFGMNSNYNPEGDSYTAQNALVTVSDTGVVATVKADANLIKAENIGDEIVINHTNSSVSYYIVHLNIMVKRPGESGGYPRWITVEVKVTADELATGVYKNKFEQVNTDSSGDNAIVSGSTIFWKDGDTYKVYDANYEMYDTKAYIGVYGYTGADVLATYQTLTYNYAE